MTLNLSRCRDYLNGFEFQKLFIEELGWSNPGARHETPFAIKEKSFSRCPLAELAGVIALEIKSEDGEIPDAKTRLAIHKVVAKHYHENLLIFVDAASTQSLWYWVKRQDGKLHPRSHTYVKGQPGDLFLSKLSAMVFEIGDFEATGDVPLIEVTERLKTALDVEQVTKKFYGEFQDQHLAFMDLIKGIKDEKDRRWYASVLLHRLMFIYFLQKKFFLDGGDEFYLQNKLATMQRKGKDLYFQEFLKPLFFEGFAKPEDDRSNSIKQLLGKIRYLNGGLFLRHRIEIDWPNITVPDEAFKNLLTLFADYSWNLNDTPGGKDNEINPDVLGYIFEKYINQKAFGAYYTRPEITEYLCERTIHQLILDGVNKNATGASRRFDEIGDLLLNLDARLCQLLLDHVLPDLRLLDPACGSAAFLVAAMKTLINVYSAVIGRIEFLGHKGLMKKLEKIQKDHPSISYFIKKRIITDNLFGVDIMEEAVEIAKLRLFLALVAAASKVEELEPLPNIEFNIMAGNSLIGLLHVDPSKFNALTGGSAHKKKPAMVREPGPDELGFAVESKVAKTRKETEREYLAKIQGQKFEELLKEKNELVAVYRRATGYGTDLQQLRDGIKAKKQAAQSILNKLLLEQFTSLDIKYEQVTWDDKKNKAGRSKKRDLRESDILAQKPFHWGYEFDEIINKRGGFDAIITNPPWEIFKPNGKEFFEDYSDAVSKKKMTIKEFQNEQAKLLNNPRILSSWLDYLSGFPHLSGFFRSAEQYHNQISIVNGKKAGTDINLYKLFLEQCHSLLRSDGRCGIIVPSGVYTDLGTKQLREMLFGSSRIDRLFGLSNEKFVFENVHHAFKFCILSFVKGGTSESFQAAFRINPREAVAADKLEEFLHTSSAHIDVSVGLIRKLAPDSLSVMEFRSALDVQIAKQLLHVPLLGEDIPGQWNLRFSAEFHMTNDSHLFKTESGKGRLPLYEGKMIWHFDHLYADPKWWVEENEGRLNLLGKEDDSGQKLGYESIRLGFRDITATTNERSLIASIIPAKCYAGNTLVVSSTQNDPHTLVFVTSLFDSFTIDWLIRKKITAHCNMFYMYQLPIPRLTKKDAALLSIVERTARLICTTSEFDDLAKDIFGGRATAKSVGVTESVACAKLRAELDGLIAHLYGLTEDEFAHILTTFPLVPDPVKVAARNAYRDVEKGLIK